MTVYTIIENALTQMKQTPRAMVFFAGTTPASVMRRCLFLLVILSAAKNPRISSLPDLVCHSAP
jgi:hypothetical protein